MLQPAGLRTERLLLRPFRARDANAVHAWASDGETTKYMDWGPNRPQDTVRFIEMAMRHAEQEDAPAWEFAVVEQATDALIGGAGIHFVGRSGVAEIGYCFARQAWGRGCATEAARALVEFGFTILDVHRIQARCDPDNLRSARVLEKLGMRLEGRLRECVQVRGEWKDRLMFAVLAHER